jgi:hypothetical protein
MLLLLLPPLLLAVAPIVLSPLLSNLLFSRLGMKREKTRRLHLLANKPPCLVNKPRLLQHLILRLQGSRKMRSRRRHRHQCRHHQRPETIPFLVLLL